MFVDSHHLVGAYQGAFKILDWKNFLSYRYLARLFESSLRTKKNKKIKRIRDACVLVPGLAVATFVPAQCVGRGGSNLLCAETIEQ